MNALLDSPERAELLVEFFVESGLANAPNLARLDAIVSAQKRSLLSSRLSYATPTFAAQGSVKQTFMQTQSKPLEFDTSGLIPELPTGATASTGETGAVSTWFFASCDSLVLAHRA